MKNKYLIGYFLLLSAALLLLVPAGCTQKATEQEMANGTFLVDLMGRRVAITGEIDRIISLSPQHTEILFALGLEEKVVAVTDFCNYPPQAANIKKVGGFTDTNIEILLTLQPDLVLAGSPHRELVQQLEERNIPVLAMEPRSLAEIYETIRLIGAAAGAEKAAGEMTGEIKEQVSIIQERLSSLSDEERIPVYYELWYDPPMSVGNRSFIHEVITLAGGENIFADLDDNYPTVSAETVAQKNPRVILFSSDHGTVEAVREQYALRPGWDKINAYQENRIHSVDGDLFNRAGPRIGHAVETAAALFYPALFEN